MRHLIDQNIDDLNKIAWEFIFMELNYGNPTVYLDSMMVMSRPSTKHKFRINTRQSYSRINQRDFGLKEEPDVPIDIAVDAVEYMRKQTIFQKWPRRA